jgi:hypothetical protein
MKKLIIFIEGSNRAYDKVMRILFGEAGVPLMWIIRHVIISIVILLLAIIITSIHGG